MTLKAAWVLGLRDVRRSGARSWVSVLGVAFGVGVLFLVLGLGLGARRYVLKEVVASLPVDMVQVIPRTVDLGLVKVPAGKLLGAATLDDAAVRMLKELPQAQAVYPVLDVKLPMSAQGGSSLFGRSLRSDFFLNGMPMELLEPEIGEVPKTQGAIPIVVSTHLLELYNTSVAPALGTPQLTGETLRGFEFELMVGRSYIMGGRGASRAGVERARIVGVSRYAMRLGATVPLTVAQRLLQQYGTGEPTTYSSVLVQAKHPSQVVELTQAVRAAGYEVDASAARASDILTLVTLILGALGAMVLALAALGMSHSFYASTTQRQKEFAVLRAVGATGGGVVALIVVHAAVLGLCGGVVGIGAAYGLSLGLDRLVFAAFPDFPFSPESFFAQPWGLWVGCLAAAIFSSVLGALWPAIRVARASVARSVAG